MQGACFFVSHIHPLIAICSSNDSSWQALKVSQRNPHPETYYYVVIAPKGYINSSTSSYDETDGTIIRFRQFPVDDILAVSHESHTSPQYGTLSNRLDEPYNFANMIGFEKTSVKLLEVKNCQTSP